MSGWRPGPPSARRPPPTPARLHPPGLWLSLAGASLSISALGCPPAPFQTAPPQEPTAEGSLVWSVDSGRADAPAVSLLRVGMLPLEIPGTGAKEGHESLLLGASPTLHESLTSLEMWCGGAVSPHVGLEGSPAPDTAHTGSLCPSLWQTRGLRSNLARAGVPATAPGLLRWAFPPWGMCPSPPSRASGGGKAGCGATAVLPRGRASLRPRER